MVQTIDYMDKQKSAVSNWLSWDENGKFWKEIYVGGLSWISFGYLNKISFDKWNTEALKQTYWPLDPPFPQIINLTKQIMQTYGYLERGIMTGS